MRAHMVCLLRSLLLLPVVACIVVAWLAAATLATAWTVLAAPFRRTDAATKD
jgi:hypothetical protein